MTVNPIKNLLQGQDGSRLSQYLSVVSASIALFSAGIHLGWPAPSLKAIMSPVYPFDINEEEASYIVIISCVGHVIGGVSASTLADIIGRKWTILSIALPQVISLVLIYNSYYSKYLLYCARVLGGIGEGAALATLPTYIAEVAEPEIRGFLGTFMSLVFNFGMLFVNLVGSFLDIHTTALVGLTFPILQWLVFVHFPETPYYYLIKKNKEQAVKSLQILRRQNNVWKEVYSLSIDVDRQMSESGRYTDLFTIPSNRKAFILVSITRFFQQFTGCSAYGLYCQLLISEATNLSPVLGSSLLMITQLIVTTIASLFIDKLGRKPLFTLSAGLCCCFLYIQGTFATLKAYTSLDLSHMQWFPLFVMIFYIICFSMGLGVGVNIFVSEIYSSSIRAKALSLGSVVMATTMMGSIKYYQYTADNYGLYVPFYSFATLTLISAAFFHFLLPETKGKTLETIQQELKERSKKGKLRFNM